MSESPDIKQETTVQVRYSLPEDCHKKIKSHQRKLSAKKDSDATMEEALIDFIRTSKPKN